MKNEKTEITPVLLSQEQNLKKTQPYDVAADSFTGLVRKRNEDSYVYAWDADRRFLFAAVADGIGSTVNGDIAGNYLLQLMVKAWRNFQVPKKNAEKTVSDFLFDTVCEINNRLYQINAQGVYPNNDSLGTTVAAAVFLKNTVVAVNAGDSPIFRIRGEEIRQLTFDHNLANELVRTEQITLQDAGSLDRGRMLTRFIGPRQDIEPECYVFDVLPDDCFLLCSDGLTLHLQPEEICRILCDSKRKLTKAMKIMLGKTLQRGAMDNATLILVKAL